MVLFAFFFTKCTVLNRRKVANNYVPGLYAYIDDMASMVILGFSMVKGSIINKQGKEVELK